MSINFDLLLCTEFDSEDAALSLYKSMQIIQWFWSYGQTKKESTEANKVFISTPFLRKKNPQKEQDFDKDYIYNIEIYIHVYNIYFYIYICIYQKSAELVF